MASSANEGIKHIDFSSGRFEAPSLATSTITDVEQRRAINLAAFWDVYGAQLRIKKDEVATLSSNELGGITYNKFYQVIRGHKVWGSEISIMSDSTGKIASAHGSCLNSDLIPATLLEAAAHPPVTREMAIQELKHEIERRFARDSKQAQPVGSESLSSAPLEWHRGRLVVGGEGTVSLAYHFDGSWHEVGSRGGPGIIFDAFVDATSGNVLQFIDKSARVGAPGGSVRPGRGGAGGRDSGVAGRL